MRTNGTRPQPLHAGIYVMNRTILALAIVLVLPGCAPGFVQLRLSDVPSSSGAINAKADNVLRDEFSDSRLSVETLATTGAFELLIENLTETEAVIRFADVRAERRDGPSVRLIPTGTSRAQDGVVTVAPRSVSYLRVQTPDGSLGTDDESCDQLRDLEVRLYLPVNFEDQLIEYEFIFGPRIPLQIRKCGWG